MKGRVQVSVCLRTAYAPLSLVSFSECPYLPPVAAALSSGHGPTSRVLASSVAISLVLSGCRRRRLTCCHGGG